MGIKSFSKVFTEEKTLKSWKEVRDSSIAVDVSFVLWRAALGAKSIKTLTDPEGNPTLHINSLLANIVKWRESNISTIWIFDYHAKSSIGDEFHNKFKQKEIDLRKKRREVAQKKLQMVKKSEVLFSSSDEEDALSSLEKHTTTSTSTTSTTTSTTTSKDKNANVNVSSYEKQAFVPSSSMYEDIAFILNCLNIPYLVSPESFEAEQIAAYLNNHNDDPFMKKHNLSVDGVYTGDTDPIPYGAKVLYRIHPKTKKILQYTQEDILKQIKASSILRLKEMKSRKSKTTKSSKDTVDTTTRFDKLNTVDKIRDYSIDDIRKICVMLGSEGADKTKGIGPASVFKKFEETVLTNSQKEKIGDFSREVDISKLKFENIDKTPFEKCDYETLKVWLIEVKGFSETRINDVINKLVAGPVLPKKRGGRRIIKSPVNIKTNTTSSNSREKYFDGASDLDDADDAGDMDDEPGSVLNVKDNQLGNNSNNSLDEEGDEPGSVKTKKSSKTSKTTTKALAATILDESKPKRRSKPREKNNRKEKPNPFNEELE